MAGGARTNTRLRGGRVIRFDQWWLPDDEQHLQQWMTKVNQRVHGRLTYQHAKWAAAAPYVKQWRVAVDVGAHVGLWTHTLAERFKEVVAFEPVLAHRECWDKNLAGLTNVRLYACALGETAGEVCIKKRPAGSSGDRGVDPIAELSTLRASVNGNGELCDMKRLDDFALPVIDFLKMDCEGYEVYIVRGGLETIARCKPCVIVEQKPETGHVKRYGIGPTDAVDELKKLGATVRQVIQGDYILSW